MNKASTSTLNQPAWVWPVDLEQYDRAPALSSAETATLAEYVRAYEAMPRAKSPNFDATLQRLIRPLDDVLEHTALRRSHCEFAVLFLLREISRRGRSFWGWSAEEWIETINTRRQEQNHVLAIAWLLCGFTRLEDVGGAHLVYASLARKVFGGLRVDDAVARVRAAMTGWGYAPIYVGQYMQRTVCEALLYNRNPELMALTTDLLQSLRQRRGGSAEANCLVALSRVLVSLGAAEHPLLIWKPATEKLGYRSLTENVPAEWARLCRHWFDTSTRVRSARRSAYYFLLNVGRWLS